MHVHVGVQTKNQCNSENHTTILYIKSVKKCGVVLSVALVSMHISVPVCTLYILKPAHSIPTCYCVRRWQSRKKGFLLFSVISSLFLGSVPLVVVVSSPRLPQLHLSLSFHATIALQLTTAHTCATCSLHNLGIVQM